MYVIFEQDTGKVLGISPKSEENSIEVDLDRVLGLLEGKESRKNYKVEYNPKTKQLDLVNLHSQSLDGLHINDFIYEIPELYEKDADITIEQNQKETCWKVIVGNSLKKSLRKKGIRFNSRLNFSITAKHDPNILYKSFFVDFSQILKENHAVLGFTMPFEYENRDISVFTSRNFDTYQFRRIFNDQN